MAGLPAVTNLRTQTGATVSQVIIAWIRQHNPAILPIIASSKIAQIAESVDALKLELTPEQMRRLYTAGDPADTGGVVAANLRCPFEALGVMALSVRMEVTS